MGLGKKIMLVWGLIIIFWMAVVIPFMFLIGRLIMQMEYGV